MSQWKKIDRGFYSLVGTRYAVMVDGFEKSQSVGAGWTPNGGYYEGFAGGEWAVVRYKEGEAHEGQNGDNLDWFPTMREARAMAEDCQRNDERRSAGA